MVKEPTETLCEFTNLTRDDINVILRDPEAPESLKAFLDCLPFGYHTVGCVPDPTKTYQPDEIQRVCSYLKSKMAELAES